MYRKYRFKEPVFKTIGKQILAFFVPLAVLMLCGLVGYLIDYFIYL